MFDQSAVNYSFFFLYWSHFWFSAMLQSQHVVITYSICCYVTALMSLTAFVWYRELVITIWLLLTFFTLFVKITMTLHERCFCMTKVIMKALFVVWKISTPASLLHAQDRHKHIVVNFQRQTAQCRESVHSVEDEPEQTKIEQTLG